MNSPAPVHQLMTLNADDLLDADVALARLAGSLAVRAGSGWR
jgi:hypothetical protein